MDTQTNQAAIQPDPNVIDPEIIEVGETSQALERIPETVTQLATRGAEGKAVIKAREEIVDTAVRASIRLTHPQDWVLFKDKITGRVTGFLQDSGCKRIDRIWGIQVTPKPGFEKIEEAGEFVIVISGDAYCKLTDTWINDVRGMRSSEEKFAEQAGSPLQKLFRVQQAARANLDGNCIRRLSGLQSVPEAFLNECWKGTGRTTNDCSLGRGFGNRQDREGTDTRGAGDPKVQAPICEACSRPMKYYGPGSKDGRTWEATWKCADYKWDSAKRESVGGHGKVSASDWEKTLAAAQQKMNGSGSEPAQPA